MKTSSLLLQIPVTSQATFAIQSLTTYLNSAFLDRNQQAVVERVLSLSKTGQNLTERSLFQTFGKLDGILFSTSVTWTLIAVLTFTSKFRELFDRHLPTVKLTKKQCKTLLKPWITPGIIKYISKRDFLYRKFIQAKNPETKSQYHIQFKSYRNLIATLCRQSKFNYFTDYFNQHSTNIRKVWLGVKNLISLKSSKPQNPITISVGNSVSSDPLTVSNKFNDFFSSVADTVRSSIPNTNHHFSNFLKHRNPNSLFLSPTTPEEVAKIIGSFSESKSSGPHSIPVRILKLINLEIATPISNLINRSFETGIFPTLLKSSKVIPIFKNKGSPMEVSNYRPISLLSNIEKIYEKAMQLHSIYQTTRKTYLS